MMKSIYDLSKKCIICGKPISQRFHICEECAEKYDLNYPDGKLKPPSEWPDWVRDRYNSSRRWNRSQKKCYESWVDIEYYDELVE